MYIYINHIIYIYHTFAFSAESAYANPKRILVIQLQFKPGTGPQPRLNHQHGPGLALAKDATIQLSVVMEH